MYIVQIAMVTVVLRAGLAHRLRRPWAAHNLGTSQAEIYFIKIICTNYYVLLSNFLWAKLTLID